jgi:hypothetical protein
VATRVQRTTLVKINLHSDRLSRLKAELAAVELWDSDYYRTTVHNPIDCIAYQARQKRRAEILAEIFRLSGSDLRAFRLKFF